MVFQQQLNLRTTGHGEMHDLTRQVQEAVRSSGVQTGTAHVFAIGSTAALGMIEFEPGLEKDLPPLLNRSCRRAGRTVTNKPGTTAMAIRICRPRCWGPP